MSDIRVEKCASCAVATPCGLTEGDMMMHQDRFDTFFSADLLSGSGRFSQPDRRRKGRNEARAQSGGIRTVCCPMVTRRRRIHCRCWN
jgi:hypothetical protein